MAGLWKKLNQDLTNPLWIYLKGFLFLLIGIVSGVMILMDNFSLKTGLLLCLVIWGFCRFYYFMFYVIERYVDPEFRFAGIGSFVKYLLSRNSEK